jgi:hypothetical protein
VLGIDIHHNAIRVVNLRQRGNRFILQQAATVPYAPEQAQNPAEVGRLLAQTIEEHSWNSRRAVMTVPGQPIFIRRLPDSVVETACPDLSGRFTKSTIDILLDSAKKSLLVPADQMIFDLWFGHGSSASGDGEPSASARPTVLLGAARKEQVDFYRELIAASGIKIQSLTPRPLALVNGLFFHWAEVREDNFALIYLEEDQAQIALMDDRGLITIQPTDLTVSDSGAPDPAALIEQYQRLIHVIQLSHGGGLPQRLFIAGTIGRQREMATLAKRIGEKLSISATQCARLEGISAADELANDSSLMDYVPAIGAALDGLEISPTWFNFLNPRSMRTRKKNRITWKPFAILAAVLIAAFIVFWLYLVRQRTDQLKQLQQQIEQTEPMRAGMLEARKNWNLFSGFVSSRHEGRRQQYLNILDEITRLFPETHDAYVTELILSSVERTGLATTYDVTINGKVRQGDVLTAFIEQLNKSELFQEARQAGSLTQDPGDVLYPFNFSVTCNLKRIPLESKP